MYMYKRQTT